MFARSPWRPLRKNAFIRTKQMTGVFFYRLLNRITVLRWYLYTHTITTASFYTPAIRTWILDLRISVMGTNHIIYKKNLEILEIRTLLFSFEYLDHKLIDYYSTCTLTKLRLPIYNFHKGSYKLHTEQMDQERVDLL